MVIHKCHVLELRITIIVNDHRSFSTLLAQQREWPEVLNLNVSDLSRCWSRPEVDGDSNHDLCDAGAMLHQLSYQANLDQLAVGLIAKPPPS